MAGYSGTPLAKKLGLKAGQPMLLLGVPANVREIIHAETLHAKTRFSGRGSYDLILVFVKSRAELEDRFAKLARCLTPAGALWVAWPKKASKVATDMTEDAVRDVALPLGLVDNKVCAVDEVWSGLRCVIRKENR
ncbi:MAG: DUF3052 family protein [Myxococcales bacterium]|nr:DUF3052 family protein [Myxococcales bacterium]